MKRLFLLFLMFPFWLQAQVSPSALDSLREIYHRSGLSARIDLVRALDKSGEKKERLNQLMNELRKEVAAQKTDSVKYHFMQLEGDFTAYSGNNGEGLKKYIECLRYYEKTGEKKKASSVSYKIGRYYFYTGDLKKAVKYIRLSDHLAGKDDVNRMATNDMVLGVIYQNMFMLDSALYYQQRSLEIKEKYGLVKEIPISLNNVAELYANLGQDQKAMETIDRSIQLSDSLHVADALAYAQHVKGTLYNKDKKYEQALIWLLPAARFWENRRTYDDLKQSYHEIVTAYAGEGNYKQAYEYLQRERAASDSVMNEVKLKNASDLEAKYQNEKDALEIARQKAENEVVENQKKNQFTIFILVAVFLVIYALVFYSRYKKQKKDKELIALQKSQLEVRNKDIEDSISYSSKVQQSIFPSVSDFSQSFRESFILFRPKEKVSGDFYWHERRPGLVLFAAADCTGHGVPGAMVSVVCSGALNRAVKEFGITDPGKVLDKARELVVETFEKSESEVKDGMDISFCVYNPQNRELFWAGANNPLWIIRHNGQEVEQVDPNKQPIGRHSSADPFTTHRVPLQSGDVFYVFTDGYADQFGGEKGKKFKAAKMKELLLQVRNEPMDQQKLKLEKAFDQWRGDLEQIDDVCVIGIKI